MRRSDTRLTDDIATEKSTIRGRSMIGTLGTHKVGKKGDK